jgi:beta-lactamase regulating signal transducer with metallopeptidase domain
MIAAWMLYCVAVTAALILAGITAERLMRAFRAPIRAVWMIVLLASVLPIAALLRAGRDDTGGWTSATTSAGPAPRASTTARPAPGPMQRLVLRVPADARIARLDRAFVALWVASSTLALLLLGGAMLRLRRVRFTGRPERIAGVDVVVTGDLGPLAVGLRRPVIVVPRWVLALAAHEQELLVAHEAEHARARDPMLLVAGAVLVALAPWNPLLWYARRRLQRAIELDCDRRVLAGRPDRARYADLLLSVASRASFGPAAAPGLGGSTISLEERVRLMFELDTPVSARRLATSGAALVILLGIVAMAPRPVAAPPATLDGFAAVAGRATGRVKVSIDRGSVVHARQGVVTAIRVYAEGGSFRRSSEPATVRRDTLTLYGSEAVSMPSEVLDVDVTDGPVHFVSTDSANVHIEAAMTGDSPALWLSASGPHIVIDRGGAGVHGAGSSPITPP